MESGLISHADKVLFPERGETKGDLAEYYLGVAEPLMRTMGGRPVLLQRFPEGAGGPSFFQKRVPKNAPGWLQTTTVAPRVRRPRTTGSNMPEATPPTPIIPSMTPYIPGPSSMSRRTYSGNSAHGAEAGME